MTFADYWDRLKNATPGLSNDENRMTLSVLNFRIAISRAYAAGSDEVHEAIAQKADELAGDHGMLDVFKDIFGGKR